MRKIFYSFLFFMLFSSFIFANCQELNQNSNEKINSCDKCIVEDDEYCIYNECYFDKHFRQMKRDLSLTRRQEICVDNIYRNFKSDMEKYSEKYMNAKNSLLKMIECDEKCQKDKISELKDIKRDIKIRCSDFRDEIKEQLCNNQQSNFRHFQREQKRKMKKILRYSAVHKLPCVDCACN